MGATGGTLFSWLIPRGDEAERTALIADGVSVRYAELDELSARYAGALVAAGVTPGDRVLVLVGKSVNAIALYLAVLRAGAVHVPLNTSYTRAELAYFLDDARPTLVVA